MIQDIIDGINTSLSDCLNLEDSIYYGIAKTIELPKKEGMYKYPVTPIAGKIEKICFNDAIDLQVFHKIDKASVENSEDFSFGKKTTYALNYEVRTIAILKSSISERNPNFNPESIAIIIPEVLTISDYKLVTTNIINVTLDHDFLVNREWKNIDYSKHKCKFFVFEIVYNIRALTCKLSCTSFLLLEDLDRLIYEDDSAILL